MPGDYRCSHGHVWEPPPDETPTVCPVCGDRTLQPHVDKHATEPTYVVTVSSGYVLPGGKDPTLPPDNALGRPAGDSRPANTEPELPSFSSLVGMPGQGATLADADQVPFGPDPNGAQSPPVVPGFEILSEIGRGGMGVVYKARQLSLNRIVALKMILSGSHAGPTERDRFWREAEAVASLQNPNIVQIFEFGEANGHPYLALEYVEGGSLAQHLAAKSSWPPRAAAELVELLARAVHYAHTKGVVHRDLKPGNILLAADLPSSGNGASAKVHRWVTGTPKITDFGLAKRLGDSGQANGTKTGAVIGTPSYIAPEQASGKSREVGAAADVYSLGAILYELLCGRPPFLGETALETVLQVLNDDPVPPKRLQPSVPRDLETICLKALNKSPSNRYTTALDFADDLRRFLNGESILARPLSSWGRLVKWARRHPALTVLGVITLLATIALVSTLSIAYAQVREAIRIKEEEASAAREARQKEADARRDAERLAAENEAARQNTELQNQQLQRQAERTRRAAYALQLSQIAALCERDPRRARDLLEDERRCPAELRDFTWFYLRRLCRREERVYTEHTDAIYTVAYSPTGQFVATAGDAGVVRVWDPRTGRTWAVLLGNTRRVLGVAFSPDGGTIATAGADGAVRLWELPVGMIEGARRSLDRFPFIPSSVAGVDLEKPLRLENAVTLADTHQSEVNCVAFSPDGRWLVSGGEDRMIRWWNLSGWKPTNPSIAVAGAAAACAATLTAAAAEGKPVWEHRALVAHPGGVLSLSFAASGRFLASGGGGSGAGGGGGQAALWAADGSELIRSLGSHADAVRAVALSPQGKYVATVSNGSTPTIRLIDTETRRDIHRLTGHTSAIYSLAFSPEGDLLVSAGFDKSVRLWSVEDGRERSVLHGHEITVTGVAFAPDRQTVVSVSADRTARVWQTAPRPSKDIELFPGRNLTAVDIARSAGAIAAGVDHGLLRAYRLETWPARPAAPGQDPLGLSPALSSTEISVNRPLVGVVKAVAISPDGTRLVAATEDGKLVFWHVPRPPRGRGRPVSTLLSYPPVVAEVPAMIYAAAFSPDGRRLATLDAGGIRVWETDDFIGDRPLAERGRSGVPVLWHAVDSSGTEYRELAFHPRRDWLAVATRGGVRILDLKTAQVLSDVRDAHESKVEALAWEEVHGELLATADAEGLIRVWKVGPNASLTPQAELAWHTGGVYSLAFSPNGRTLASGGYDRAIVLWDPMTGQERAVLTGHNDRILRVQFLPDDLGLISLGRNGTLKCWGVTPGPGTPAAERSPTLKP